ncbi:hypothetical protein MAM1_0104c05351 [Mucor ambiguus]|uniref:Uncharacterized protein n=1 Tax=Mucor ambiguus TaxID=91626 RepID=A0A0C9LUZ3_9FUNG|nr:hypothetical protein MAM1_0104c05351 [Mucor ambiguus]
MKMESSQALNMDSFMYTQDMTSHSTLLSSSNACSSLFNHTISPKEYQKRKSNHQQKKSMPSSSPSLSSQKPRKVAKAKKIILGKPCNGKHKMNLQELKALSRQIRPYSTAAATSTCTTTTTTPATNAPLSRLNAQIRSEQDLEEDNTKNIAMLGRSLRERLFKAKSKMMDNLKNSEEPEDVLIYNNLIKSTLPLLVKNSNSNNTSSDDDEDDCSSVSTLSSVQLRLVTDASGRVSVVSDDFSSTTSSLYDEGYNNDSCYLFGHDSTCTSIMPLYTPSSMMEMDMYLQQPSWYQSCHSDINNDVTEDQINSWLQRGGHDDSIDSPITMATDQELADLLEFDAM